MVVSYHEEQAHRKPMEEHEQNGITSTTSFIDDQEEQEEALIALVNHRCRQVKNLHDQVPPFSFLSFFFFISCSLCHMLPSFFTHMVWLIMLHHTWFEY
jgi:hypothetical protein